MKATKVAKATTIKEVAKATTIVALLGLLLAGCATLRRCATHDGNDHEYWGDQHGYFMEGDMVFEGWILK